MNNNTVTDIGIRVNVLTQMPTVNYIISITFIGLSSSEHNSIKDRNKKCHQLNLDILFLTKNDRQVQFNYINECCFVRCQNCYPTFFYTLIIKIPHRPNTLICSLVVTLRIMRMGIYEDLFLTTGIYLYYLHFANKKLRA